MEIKEKDIAPHVYTKYSEGNQFALHPSGMISRIAAALEYKDVFILLP